MVFARTLLLISMLACIQACSGSVSVPVEGRCYWLMWEFPRVTREAVHVGIYGTKTYDRNGNYRYISTIEYGQLVEVKCTDLN